MFLVNLSEFYITLLRVRPEIDSKFTSFIIA
jgi:hypothetical protein